jgi:uncharacterized protein (DUF1330 family)
LSPNDFVNNLIMRSLECFLQFIDAKETPMPKAYWISAYRSIHNEDALAAYAKLAGPALTAAGGRFLARGLPAAVKEAGVQQRTVLVEFDSLDAALAAYDCPAYKEALAALGDNAVMREIRIMEGA